MMSSLLSCLDSLYMSGDRQSGQRENRRPVPKSAFFIIMYSLKISVCETQWKFQISRYLKFEISE